MNTAPKPKQRGNLHFYLAKKYFTFKRFISWHLSRRNFCVTRQDDNLPYPFFRHDTVFMRQLQRVDMYLQENKKTNIRLASERLDGIIIKPGETFSFWRLIGRPTRAKGFLDGLLLSQGKLKKGLGGGICQLSNLIFWMTLHTPLKVTERWRHSYDVFPDVNRSQPFGSGATVSYNYIDLQIYNPTAEFFQLRLWQDDERLYGEWRGECAPRFSYEIYERNHRIESQFWGGYTRHNELFRSVCNLENGEQTEEFITANNALMMYNPHLEAGKNEESA